MNETKKNLLLGRQLQALPEPVLPDDIWQQVRQGRRGMQRRRLIGIGGVLSVAVVAFGLSSVIGPQADDAAPALVASDPVDIPAPEADIRAIDAALQAAYAQGLPDADISPLWQARERLMALREARPRLQPANGGQS